MGHYSIPILCISETGGSAAVIMLISSPVYVQYLRPSYIACTFYTILITSIQFYGDFVTQSVFASFVLCDYNVHLILL